MPGCVTSRLAAYPLGGLAGYTIGHGNGVRWVFGPSSSQPRVRSLTDAVT